MKICWKHSSLQSIFPYEHRTNWQWACCSALYPRRNPTLETVISITGDVYVCMGNNILGPLSLLSGLFCEVNWWCVPINAVHSHVYRVPWGILYLFTQHLFSPKKPSNIIHLFLKVFFSFTYTGMHCSPLEKSAHEEFLLFARQPSPLRSTYC